MYDEYKDHVKCCNCMEVILVNVGEEECPKCGFTGALMWVNPEEPEVRADYYARSE